MVIVIWGRGRLRFCEDDALGRICKSAPTVCVNFVDEWVDGADASRWGGLRGHRVGVVCVIWGRGQLRFCKDDALGRIYKSAPTVCVNFMDEWRVVRNRNVGVV